MDINLIKNEIYETIVKLNKNYKIAKRDELIKEFNELYRIKEERIKHFLIELIEEGKIQQQNGELFRVLKGWRIDDETN
jgi:coenzyme F420-reducing hydrogenase delta subunit